jgi:hypothetical protein
LISFFQTCWVRFYNLPYWNNLIQHNLDSLSKGRCFSVMFHWLMLLIQPFWWEPHSLSQIHSTLSITIMPLSHTASFSKSSFPCLQQPHINRSIFLPAFYKLSLLAIFAIIWGTVIIIDWYQFDWGGPPKNLFRCSESPQIFGSFIDILRKLPFPHSHQFCWCC